MFAEKLAEHFVDGQLFITDWNPERGTPIKAGLFRLVWEDMLILRS